MRRRVAVAEEHAVVVDRSPGKAVAIDQGRPEAHQDIDDDDIETWDIFAPLEIDEGLRARPKKKPIPLDAEALKAQDLARDKYRAECAKLDEEWWADRYAISASKFRDEWNALWSRGYGPFEATTEICNMRFTDEPAPSRTNTCSTLQIFSAKVTKLGGGLQWPLDVFGMVALRDTIDHRRNIVFDRKRDNCQTLTEKNPYLVLTGPTRAVMLLDPVTIEAKLLVKGTVESEDKILSYIAVEPFICSTLRSKLLTMAYPNKLSALEFTLGQILFSVEATIFLRVIDGSWPDGFSGRFVAKTASIDQEMVLLLHSGDRIIPCTDDGNVKLLRCVASVEVDQKLEVSTKAWKVDNSGMKENELFMAEEANEDYMEEGGVHAPILADSSVEKKVVFTAKRAGRSEDTLDIGLCKIKVTVAWSLIDLVCF